VHDVEARVEAELARLRDEPVGEAELERARRVFFADWVHGVERIHEQALMAGLAAALHDLAQPQRLLRAIARVTPASLQKAAARWLDPAAGSVVGVHLPESA
jgi:predicted Zn-dependent peptidase